jgi:hypothetical protein
VPLARFRPLWEVQLIYGLDGGGMALVIKGHHLILDGLIAWQGITATLVDLAPEGVEIDRADWAPPPLPTKGEAARHAVAHRAQTVRKRVSNMGTSAKDPEQRRRELDTLRAVPATIRDEVAPRAPRLPINGPIGIRREVSWVALPLPEIKAAAAASAEHVTVNDVVLALVSEGLRELLLSTGLSHPLPSPRVNVPISVARRTQGRVSFDERDAYMVIDMDLAEHDLAKRLVAIRECTEIRKTREATVIEEMLDVVFMLPNRERERAWRVLASARVFNAVLSNIQGIQQDLWFRGPPDLHHRRARQPARRPRHPTRRAERAERADDRHHALDRADPRHRSLRARRAGGPGAARARSGLAVPVVSVAVLAAQDHAVLGVPGVHVELVAVGIDGHGREAGAREHHDARRVRCAVRDLVRAAGTDGEAHGVAADRGLLALRHAHHDLAVEHEQPLLDELVVVRAHGLP